VDYNEPQRMLEYAVRLGIPEEDIVLDYAGRRTYDSCYRAGAIFGVERAVVVTQRFHAARALYLCDALDVEAEAALAGIYVVRTSLPATRLDAGQTVRSYKLLSHVERAFRSFKTVDLMVRPIRHRLERRVRAHIFLCMLAYYVQWHMMEAWRPLLYADQDQQAKSTRDPVAPAKRSEAAAKKAATKELPDGSRTHSFQSLIHHLGAIVRNTCRCPGSASKGATFTIDTKPDAKQKEALDLLKTIGV